MTDQSEPLVCQNNPMSPRWFLCTEPDGHEGPHVARGADDTVHDTWTDDEGTEP